MVEALVIPEKGPDPVVEAAERALDKGRMLAGKDYLVALRRLGLAPDVLCWVYTADRGEMHLAVVTSMAERVDSLSIYNLLFRAYEAAATPRDIDPFIVSVYGPKSNLGMKLHQHLGEMAERGTFSTPERAALFTLTNTDSSERHVVLGRGVYVAEKGRRSAADDLRRWRRFQRSVEALAA